MIREPDPCTCKTAVRGRFAPSPTGALHFGSLVAALASFLDARSRGGEWLVRIEDLDPPREVPGAADAILRSLETHALEWDATVERQSERHERYADALARLQQAGRAYPCACSRREIADTALPGIEGVVYPGTCRRGIAPGRSARAWRLQVEPGTIIFSDEVFGTLHQEVASAVGDFVLRRADGLYAYQLAVVIDDAAQGITRVVRGADLLASTARQIYLQRALGLPTPAYAHLPIAVNAAGDKLSKLTHARALDPARAGPALVAALHFLGQTVPADLAAAGPRAILDWARVHWNLDGVAAKRARLAPQSYR